jgi:hypothetical protein
MATKTKSAAPKPEPLPFDLKKALAGAALVTREGDVASEFRQIVKPSQKTRDFPYEARVRNGFVCFTEFGTYWLNHPDPKDLFLVPEVKG